MMTVSKTDEYNTWLKALKVVQGRARLHARIECSKAIQVNTAFYPAEFAS
jgi:putative component of toxin-antitoxin plasmid stabilization module